MSEANSILDDINTEVSNLSDEEIAAAAAKISARKDRAKASMTDERKQKMKDREKRRRQLDKAILDRAKQLVAQSGTQAPA